MRRALRYLWISGAVVAVLTVAAVAAVYAISERALRQRYPTPALGLAVPMGPEAVTRGEHLARAIGSCGLCHGDDLGGKVYADIRWIGIVVGPNLTRGRGGVGSVFGDPDWVRALRYGVHPDGTTLVAMPSEVFTNFTDADLGALVAYLKQLPPVDRVLPPTRFGPLGRVLLAAGRLSIMTAPKTTHHETVAPVPVEASAEYGRYLADVGGCHGCHGFGLSGGAVAGPPGLPPAANLTPAGIGDWTEADFVRAMREGRRPDGRPLDEFMPWQSYRAMSDLELTALWRYLASVPPRPSGLK
jgi:cytochrome c553